MDPHLLNYVERRRGKGPKLVPGFCLAIEPMVSLGTPRTEVLEDDWTVITTDGTWSSHWEHSVALTEEGPLVLTAPDGGRAKLAEHGITAAPDPLAGACGPPVRWAGRAHATQSLICTAPPRRALQSPVCLRISLLGHPSSIRLSGGPDVD